MAKFGDAPSTSLLATGVKFGDVLTTDDMATVAPSGADLGLGAFSEARGGYGNASTGTFLESAVGMTFVAGRVYLISWTGNLAGGPVTTPWTAILKGTPGDFVIGPSVMTYVTNVIYGQMLYQPTSTITMTLALSLTPMDTAIQMYGGGSGYPYPRQVWVEDLGSAP